MSMSVSDVDDCINFSDILFQMLSIFITEKTGYTAIKKQLSDIQNQINSTGTNEINRIKKNVIIHVMEILDAINEPNLGKQVGDVLQKAINNKNQSTHNKKLKTIQESITPLAKLLKKVEIMVKSEGNNDVPSQQISDILTSLSPASVVASPSSSSSSSTTFHFVSRPIHETSDGKFYIQCQ